MSTLIIKSFWDYKLPRKINELAEGASNTDHIHLYDAIISLIGPLSYILEIGLNGGHSAAMWLLKTKAQLLDVDIGDHPYIQDVIDVLKKEFPGRFECIIKSSREVYPDISSKKFDLIYVDGDHSHEGCFADLMMAEKLSPKYIMIDDTDPPCDPNTTHIPRNIFVPHALADFLKRGTYKPIFVWKGPKYPRKDGLPDLPSADKVYGGTNPISVGWGGYLLQKADDDM